MHGIHVILRVSEKLLQICYRYARCLLHIDGGVNVNIKRGEASSQF